MNFEETETAEILRCNMEGAAKLSEQVTVMSVRDRNELQSLLANNT